MDSQITSKINSLQRDLGELEIRESTLLNELNTVQAKIKNIKKELADITENNKLTDDILQRVYEQRRGLGDNKR